VTTLEAIPLPGGRQLEDLGTKELAHVMVKVQGMRRAKVRDLENLTVELARAKQDATTEHAKAFLAHEGPQEERTQVAKQAAAGAVFKADVAKGKLDACKAAMDILKDDWDTCRSIGANERAQQNAMEGIGA
jgi:hypothetical protein